MDGLQAAVLRARSCKEVVDSRTHPGVPAGKAIRPANADPFFLAKLLAEIADAYGLTPSGLKSQRRFQSYFAARCEFCYRAFMECDASLVRIGRALGGRDHTTIRNAIAQHCVTRDLPLPAGVNWQYWIGRRAAQTSGYDARQDLERSITEGFRAIRERVANGGPGWEPKP